MKNRIRWVGGGGVIILLFSFISHSGRNPKPYPLERKWVIKRDTRVNEDRKGGECLQVNPEIAKIEDGYVVVWAGLRAGEGENFYLYGRGSGKDEVLSLKEWNIYLQILDPQLNPITPIIRVNDDKGWNTQANPDVTVTTEGEIVVVWEDERDKDDYDIYGQKFDKKGEKIGSNFLISEDTTNRQQKEPKVAPLEDNGFVVVWQDERRDETILGTHIYGKIYKNKPQGGGEEFKINENIRSSSYPEVFMIPNGFVVVWIGEGKMEERNVTGIWGVVFDNEGRKNKEIFKVNDTPSRLSFNSPKGIWNKRDRILVVWGDNREVSGAGYFSIFGQFYDTNLNPIGGNFKINEGEDVWKLQEHAGVGVNSLGKFIVIWKDKDEKQFPLIKGQIYNEKGEKEGKNFQINEQKIGKTSHTLRGKVTGGEGDKFFIVWENKIENDIFGRIWEGGEFLTEEKELIDEEKVRNEVYPKIKMNNKGECVIVWEERERNRVKILFQVFDKTGTPFGDVVVVEDTIKGIYYSYPAINDEGEVVIVWEESRAVTWDKIWAKKYNFYEKRWVTEKILVIAEKKNVMQPVVGLSNDGSFVVIYSSLRDTISDKCNSVYGKKFHPCGCPCGEEFAVEDPPLGFRSCESPDISMDSLGNFVVVWHHTMGPGTREIVPSGISGQRFTSECIKIGKNFKINEIIEKANILPKVVTHHKVGFGVVWMKDRKLVDPEKPFYTWREMWLQLYNTKGEKITRNIKLPKTFPISYATVFPSIAVNPTMNEYIVVWADYSENYPKIMAQRISKEGKLGKSFLVVEPTTSQHFTLVTGDNVASNGELLSFVWMDNRREKGWDVYFKLVTHMFERGGKKYYSVKIPQKLAEMEIVPNPVVKGNGVLYYWKEGEKVKAIYIYNKTGRKIDAFPIIRETPTSIKLKLNHLPSGIYFLKLVLEEGEHFRKFIIVK